jgi:hypothetical protein
MELTMLGTGNAMVTECYNTCFVCLEQRPVWVKKGVISICLCLAVILAVALWNKPKEQTDNGAGTLLGAEEIYPAVMVGDYIYEWRRGAAICNDLPEDCAYYGELIHVEGQKPNNNCEFVSTFSASGQIYTELKSDTVVYICLTTDWLDNTIVAFDRVESDE